MLSSYIDAGLLSVSLFLSSIISFITSLYYYERIKRDRSLKEFLSNLFIIYGKRSLRNTFDKQRNKYLKVNNYCMIIFWVSLILLLVYF